MKHIAWKCPNCQSALIPMLTEKPYVLRCTRGHSFDLAKQGYVNLLLPQKRGAALPGDNAEIEVKLITPVAMEEGLRFAIREGGHTVGAGVVTKIIE